MPSTTGYTASQLAQRSCSPLFSRGALQFGQTSSTDRMLLSKLDTRLCELPEGDGGVQARANGELDNRHQDTAPGSYQRYDAEQHGERHDHAERGKLSRSPIVRDTAIQ